MEESGLVDSIYRAALEPSHWAVVVERIGRILGANAGLMMVPASFGVPAVSYAAFGIHMSAETDEYYATIRGRATLTHRAIETGRAPGIFDLRELCPSGERRTDDFWVKGLEPLGWTDGMVTVLRLPREESGPPVILNYFRDARGGSMETGEPRTQLEALFPHLRRALGLALSSNAGVTEGAALGLLEALGDPVFAVTHEGDVVTGNHASLDLLSRRSELSVTHSRLRFTSPVAQNQFTAALAAARSRSPARCDFVVSNALDVRPLFVSLSPIRSLVRNAMTSEDGHQILVRIVEADLPPSPESVVRLRDFFGLTSAEAMIALALSSGHTPEAIAIDRGSSVGTVRLQIKSALAKTQLSRQTALAALVAKLCR